MKDINKYYDLTKRNSCNKVLKYFIKNIMLEPTNAIDLGCGQGNDVIYLIDHGWKVLGIDKENVEERIRIRIDNKKQSLFRFELQNFENLKLNKTNLVLSNYSLPFCNKKKFKDAWKIIEESILENGFFVGNFLGDKDSWIKSRQEMTFLSKNEVNKIFNKFQIIYFDEVEIDKPTALGNPKHWHIFNVIAKKIK